MTDTIVVERGCGAIIYGLADPRSGDVRYVGKTVEPDQRLYMHLWYATHGEDTRKARWIRSLLAAGVKPELTVLEVVDGDWVEAERRWIASLPNLTNTSAGGDGVSAPRTPEWRSRIGAAHRGKQVSDEVRQRLREIRLQQIGNSCNRGHEYTEENTRLVYRNGRTHRQCRECARFYARRDRRRAGVPTLDEYEANRQPQAVCTRGHELAGDNLRIMVRSCGKVERICRECVRIRNREAKRQARQKGATT